MEKPVITIEDMAPLFAQHLIDDKNFQEDTLKRMDSMATKEDAKEILLAIKTVHIGYGIFKVGWKTFMTFAGIAGAIVAIVALWKLALAWILSAIIMK